MRESAGLLDISTDKGFARLHWRVLVGLLTIAAIVATVLIVMIVTSPGQTSYRDGYSVGTSIGGSFGATNARDDCLYAADVPRGDNPNQWLAGCIAGWNSSENNDIQSATTAS
jgi:hypothetical protein